MPYLEHLRELENRDKPRSTVLEAIGEAEARARAKQKPRPGFDA